MALTLENIPPELDAALRRKAESENKTLEEAALDAMRAGLGSSDAPIKYRDLSDLAGSWVEDPEFDAAMEEQDPSVSANARSSLSELNARMDRDPERIMRLAEANTQRIAGKPNL
jgi:hypothetical protein